MSSHSANPPVASSRPFSNHNGNACSIIKALSVPTMSPESCVMLEGAARFDHDKDLALMFRRPI